MKQEDKELLLKDLSARLYYRPTVLLSGKEHCTLCGIDGDEVYLNVDSDSFHVESIKPYLRSMSSMTEEEVFEYLSVCNKDNKDALTAPKYLGLDYLLSHHFDYRGLIEKGLALEAPEGMYN